LLSGVAKVREITLLRGEVALVDDEDFERVSEYRWYRAAHAENMRNRKTAKHNKVGLKGVQAHNGKFRARIWFDKKPFRLGTFPTPEEAHAAYVAAATRLHGAFARAA
jgi:hypothetical protein